MLLLMLHLLMLHLAVMLGPRDQNVAQDLHAVADAAAASGCGVWTQTSE